MIARRVVVAGRVQGVGFRWSAREHARSLGVCGWVRNRPDGRVEAHIEGDEQIVQAMLDWLGRGPLAASVSGVDVVTVEPQNLQGFDVTR